MSNNAAKSFTISFAIHSLVVFGWFFLHTNDKEVEKKEALTLSMDAFANNPQQDNTPMQEAPRQEEMVKKSSVKARETPQKDV